MAKMALKLERRPYFFLFFLTSLISFWRYLPKYLPLQHTSRYTSRHTSRLKSTNHARVGAKVLKLQLILPDFYFLKKKFPISKFSLNILRTWRAEVVSYKIKLSFLLWETQNVGSLKRWHFKTGRNIFRPSWHSLTHDSVQTTRYMFF